MALSRSFFHTASFAVLMAASTFGAGSAAHADDKITIMVGGYERGHRRTEKRLFAAES